MDYKKTYYKIIENRKANLLSEDEYGELHHIVPKSLGGSDDSSNLVKLTAREHFICHALLAEMYEFGTQEWYKMNHAFIMMNCKNSNQERYLNSRLYEFKRRDFSKVMSRAQSGEKNSQFGKIWVYHPIKDKATKILPGLLEEYEAKGWVQGRVGENYESRRKRLHREEKKYFMPNGRRIYEQRRNYIKKVYSIDLFTAKGVQNLHTLLFSQYVLENKSTTDLAKKYKSTDPTIRQLLLDLKIGTKDRGGNW